MRSCLTRVLGGRGRSNEMRSSIFFWGGGAFALCQSLCMRCSLIVSLVSNSLITKHLSVVSLPTHLTAKYV